MSEYTVSLNKIFYLENKDKLEKTYSEDDFLKISHKKKIEISKKLDLSFNFVLTLQPSIIKLLPIIDNFLLNSEIEDLNTDSTTSTYLIICALSIVLDLPKQIYRKLFSELRLRNVYGFLEDLTKFIIQIKNIFNFINNNNTSDNFFSLLKRKEFLDFCEKLLSVIKNNKIVLKDFVESIKEEELNNLSLDTVGNKNKTIREIIVSLLPKYSKNLDNELKKREIKKTGNFGNGKILKFGEFKGNIEQINEEK